MSQQKQKRYGIALKFHRFMLDPTAAPMYGIGESRLSTNKYVCQWSYVCRPNAPPLGQTPPKSFKRGSGAHMLEWDTVSTTVVLEEQTLSLFNERVLLLQIVEIPEGAARSGGIVMASGTIDPGVFVRKPAKDYAVKLENNFVAVGKLFFNMQVDNLEAPIFAEKTRKVSKLTLEVEKIVVEEEVRSRGAAAAAPSRPSVFVDKQDYFFKMKYNDEVHRTPTTQCENPFIVRWNYTVPVDISDDIVNNGNKQASTTRVKFALMQGTTQLSTFAVDVTKLLSSTCRQFSVPITVLKVGDKPYNAVFDFAVDRTEIVDLQVAEKQRFMDPTQTTISDHRVRSVSMATTAPGPSVSPQPRVEQSSVAARPKSPSSAAAPSALAGGADRKGLEYSLPSMFHPSELARNSTLAVTTEAGPAEPASSSPTLKERMARVRLVKPVNSAASAFMGAVQERSMSNGATGLGVSTQSEQPARRSLSSPSSSKITQLQKQLEEAQGDATQWEQQAHELSERLAAVETELGGKAGLESENQRMRALLEKQDNEIKTLRQQNVQLMRRMQDTGSAPASKAPSVEPRWAAQPNGPGSNGPSRSTSRQPMLFEQSPSISRPVPRQPPATRSGMLFVGGDDDD